MAQLLIRRVDESVKQKLRQRARLHGVSMEQEMRTILQDAVRDEEVPEYGLGTRIAALFQNIDWGDEEMQRLPRQPIKPATFDE